MENVIGIGKRFPIMGEDRLLDCFCTANETLQYEHPEVNNWTILDKATCFVSNFFAFNLQQYSFLCKMFLVIND